MIDYDNLIERLRIKINCEETLKKWDSVRDDLLQGDLGDGPRRAMESWLDEGDDQRDEAADAIETLKKDRDDLKTTLSRIANLDPSQEPWARTIARLALEKLK